MTNSKIVVAAVMPRCRCVVAYHTHPLQLTHDRLKTMLHSWASEGFNVDIMPRGELNTRLTCPHKENWPRDTHAVPIDAYSDALKAKNTLLVMQALGEEILWNQGIQAGYYSYISMHRNPLFKSPEYEQYP